MESLVSVIITTKNSAPTIGRLLKSIKAQVYKPIEIIVVDNNSKDKTPQIAKEFKTRLFNVGPERSAQRNFGVKISKGRYVLILDSDMILSKDVIGQCIDKFKNQKLGKKLGGLVILEVSFGKGIWAKAKALEREINKGEEFFESARFFPKKIFLEFGGYDQSLTGPEDWDLPQRIRKKYRIDRIESVIRHNEGFLSLKTLFRKKYYYGLSAHKYLSKQRISTISSRTVYFLRPAFYRNWRIFFKTPGIFWAMIFMLVVETIGGGLGYLVGRFRIEK